MLMRKDKLIPSLRRHYPDQVLRVSSQPFRYQRNSTPRNLRIWPELLNGAGSGYKDTGKFPAPICNFWGLLTVKRDRMDADGIGMDAYEG